MDYKKILIHFLFITILSVLPVCGLIKLINVYFGLDGYVSAERFFDKKNPLIGEISPSGRLGKIIEKDGQNFLPVNIDPVYFPVTLTTGFNDISLTLKYRDEASSSVIYAGPQVGEGFKYDLKPIQNNLLDSLLKNSDWQTTFFDNLVLFQKKDEKKIYKTVPDFLFDLPAKDKIGVFNYALPYDYAVPNYKPAKVAKIFPVNLKGAHSFLIYRGISENFDFHFNLTDLNQLPGEDAVTINLYYKGEKLKDWAFLDDGDSSDSGKSIFKGRVNIERTEGEAGVYRLQVVCEDDIVISGIETSNSLWVLENKVHLYAEGKKTAKTGLIAEARELSFIANKAEGIQMVDINGTPFPIEEAFKFFRYKNEEPEKKLALTFKPPLLINGDALFSFSREAFFNPRLVKIDENLDAIPEKISYIIADYQGPKRSKDDLRENTLSWNLSSAYLKDHKLQFMIAVPKTAERKDKAQLWSIKIELYKNKESVWDLFKRIYGKYK